MTFTEVEVRGLLHDWCLDLKVYMNIASNKALTILDKQLQFRFHGGLTWLTWGTLCVHRSLPEPCVHEPSNATHKNSTCFVVSLEMLLKP